MTPAHLATHAALCALLGITAALCLTQHHPHPEQPVSGRTAKESPMGWGSAYSLFNTIADALIEADATDEVKEKALTKVIASLQADDWDTELDSLQSYRHDPAIVRAFASNDIHWPSDD